MAVTRADVARRAGVSPALVSYVLNPGSRPVSASARARIEAAIEELGYRPNAIAQALRLSSSRSIGLVVPNLTHPIITSLAQSFETVAREHGYVMLTGCTDGFPEREAEYLRTFLSRSVDALILISTSSHDAIQAAAATGIPVLVLDRVPVELGVSTLTMDARSGAEAAVRHLIEAHGHSRIACIASVWPLHSHVEERVDGWRAALQSAGLTVDESLLVRGETFDQDGGREAMTQILDGTDATAIFSTSDIKAIGALDALRRRKLRVPEDFAIVSFGGSMLAELAWPPLTSVDQFLPTVAATVMERLLAKMGTGEGQTHDVLPTALVIRESCGCSAG